MVLTSCAAIWTAFVILMMADATQMLNVFAYAMRKNADGMRRDTFPNSHDGTRSSANGMNTHANCIRNKASGIHSSADDVESYASTIRRTCVNRVRYSADYYRNNAFGMHS